MLLHLDLQLFSGEKTEKATPTKRREVRKKGQIAKSIEISSAFTLLFSFACLMVWGKSFIEGCLDIYRHTYREYLLWDLSISSTKLLFNQLLLDAVKIIAPILLVVLIVGIATNLMQVGFMFNFSLIKVDFKKLDPLQGLKRLFSLRSLVELIKSILKITIVGVVVFVVIWQKKNDFLVLGEKNIWDVSSFIASLILQIGLAASAALLVLAVGDFIYQKYSFEKKIRMSKQEIKDEFKKMEGDPVIKGKRRAIQRQMAMNQMIREVPKADVVITNPTHFAVAIRYDIKTMDAPQVIAKGRDYIALKIKEVAKEHKVTIVENRPLARALFAAVEIGETIPEELFNAVGEILAYVYYQDGRYKGMMT
ncbi:flagellar biosynthesis protein FlhB [Neobacillus sp. OS1-32]|uniref:Flagellar biosynthetic protein FlhB n=1 Tax=Neobacillus paridis TaxID=2803862 RepID=A0ABS1TNP8_9BACI|nr:MULTISPECIES: flagellar biosynthesis protein FlhB [Neobacillus]MBL4952959.1 flagellar biosynthesis protein FlhB [Neobacillus paridis]WML31520.1 flagellar biosynthesis protein FlhB [Neobacillus sp. OS1-32]